MGMRSERNTWLSCTVLLRMLDVNDKHEELRKEQRACRGLEHDREPARQGSQRQRELKKERVSKKEKTTAGR